MAHPLVVHCNRARFDIYIGRGRGSQWENPFRIGVDGSRDEVIAQYELWLPEQPELMAQIGELADKTLGCWCAPLRCHGEVLARLAARVPVLSPWAWAPARDNGLTVVKAPF